MYIQCNVHVHLYNILNCMLPIENYVNIHVYKYKSQNSQILMQVSMDMDNIVTWSIRDVNAYMYIIQLYISSRRTKIQGHKCSRECSLKKLVRCLMLLQYIISEHQPQRYHHVWQHYRLIYGACLGAYNVAIGIVYFHITVRNVKTPSSNKLIHLFCALNERQQGIVPTNISNQTFCITDW